MAKPAHHVLIAGLGQAGHSHLAALEHISSADVIAAVDPAPGRTAAFRGHPVPVYPDPRRAATRHRPDTVVIATPTPTHPDVCALLSDCFPAASILVEKPAASTLPGARRMLEETARRQPVEVAYHMAFSPEVTWGLHTARDRNLGTPVAAEASFADPYQEDYTAASAALVSSWIDSGINALSVLARFASPVSRQSLRCISGPPESVFEAHVTFEAAGNTLDALILTSWHAADPAKTTRIRFSTGAELVMDHTAVAGYLTRGRHVTAVYGSDRAVPRRERHYRALYHSWLSSEQPAIPTTTSMRLHEILLAPESGSSTVELPR